MTFFLFKSRNGRGNQVGTGSVRLPFKRRGQRKQNNADLRGGRGGGAATREEDWKPRNVINVAKMTCLWERQRERLEVGRQWEGIATTLKLDPSSYDQCFQAV